MDSTLQQFLKVTRDCVQQHESIIRILLAQQDRLEFDTCACFGFITCERCRKINENQNKIKAIFDHYQVLHI